MGFVYLFLTSGTEDIYVAAVDIPVYHQITQSDVREKTVDQRDIPRHAVRKRAVLVGRYTLKAVRQDEPFQASKLGPLLPKRSLRKPIVALPFTPETTLGGQLANGDLVDVLLSGNATNIPPRADRTINNVRTLDIVEDGPNPAVIVTMTQLGVRKLAAVRGSSTVIVLVRTQPYEGP